MDVNRYDADSIFLAIWSEVGKQTFLEVRKSQFRKFLGSFRNRKSVIFLSVLVRNSQIRNF